MHEEHARFGAYELVRPIGAGGMAETFVGVRRGPNLFEQRVCIKRLLPHHEHDPQLVWLFLNEARLSARLRHAAIAQVVDFGAVDHRHYLALELIDGCDLRGLLRHVGGRLPAELVTHIAFELGRALEFAHAVDASGRVRGIVHRDISPANILLSRAGEVKLTDFGIAKAMSEATHTRTGIIKGKIAYMAPEYARFGRFDGRADLFSLGVTLFECVAGRRPYDGEGRLETLERARRGDRLPLEALAPGLPSPLAALIERLVDPNPDGRFADARALLSSLDGVPAPSAGRRKLGALVRAASSGGRGTGARNLASAPTVALEGGSVTVRMKSRRAGACDDPTVVPASPVETTRTSALDPDSPPTLSLGHAPWDEGTREAATGRALKRCPPARGR